MKRGSIVGSTVHVEADGGRAGGTKSGGRRHFQGGSRWPISCGQLDCPPGAKFCRQQRHVPRDHELAVPGAAGDVVEDDVLVDPVELDIVGKGDGLGDMECLCVLGRVGLLDIRGRFIELSQDRGVVSGAGRRCKMGWSRRGSGGGDPSWSGKGDA